MIDHQSQWLENMIDPGYGPSDEIWREGREIGMNICDRPPEDEASLPRNKEERVQI